MIAHFHPDGTAQLEYCARCERAALERLQQFQCLTGVMINPGLHQECKATVKRELQNKMSAVWQALEQAGKFPSMAECLKAATGIEL